MARRRALRTTEPAPLGAVEVAAGEAVQIRSLLAHDGWAAAEAGRDAIEIAVRDFGDIHGHRVDLGLPGNSMCSPAGGRAAARAVIADERVVGVIGTPCSGAGAAASELLSAAGLVMISPSNTSPSLTSDLEGNENANWYPGYFRLSNNDICTGRAAADFAFNRLSLRKVGTVDIDDVYIAGLVEAFSEAFEKLGGEVVKGRILFDDEAGFAASLAAVSRQLTDADVEGVFFPLYPAQATPFLRQLPQALRDLPLISADALLTPEFLGSQESEGLYIVGPITTFGNVNGVTGKSEAAVKEAIETAYGDTPGSYWQHSYDATTLLLDAIRSVAKMRGGKLYIDRAELRLQLAATKDFQGLIGAVSCDAFGDCGNGRTNVFHHTDASVTDAAQLEVVYQFAPFVSSGMLRQSFDGRSEGLALMRDETFAARLHDVEVAVVYDDAMQAFIGRVRNEAPVAVCDVQIGLDIYDGATILQTLYAPLMGLGLPAGQGHDFQVPYAGQGWTDWTLSVETHTCASAPAGMASGEGGEGGEGRGESGEESSPATPITESIAGTRGDQAYSFSFDPQTELFVGTVENISATNVVCGSRTEIHLVVGGNVVELGPTIPEDLAPGDVLDVVMYLHPFPSGEMVTYQLHPESSPCP